MVYWMMTDDGLVILRDFGVWECRFIPLMDKVLRGVGFGPFLTLFCKWAVGDDAVTLSQEDHLTRLIYGLSDTPVFN